MLSGVGVSELILLFVIGLLILGPERLPRVASQLGRWVGKARRTANQLRFQMEREIALAELDRTQSKKRDVNAPKSQTGSGSDSGQAQKSDGSGPQDASAAAGAVAGQAIAKGAQSGTGDAPGQEARSSEAADGTATETATDPEQR